MPRLVRVLAVAGALTGTTLLATCDKPAPKVTVQTGAFSTTIEPSTYRFDAAKAVGGRGAIHSSHSFRVAASTNNGSPFIVQVAQLRTGRPDGRRWDFLVKVSDRT